MGQWALVNRGPDMDPGHNCTSTTCPLYKSLHKTCIIKDWERASQTMGIPDCSLGSVFDLLFDIFKYPHFYLNNCVFQLKISVWFFVKFASPWPLPPALPCFVVSTNSMAKFSLLVVQALSRMVLEEKDYERPWEEGCPQKGQPSLALPMWAIQYKTPCLQEFLAIPWT